MISAVEVDRLVVYLIESVILTYMSFNKIMKWGGGVKGRRKGEKLNLKTSAL